MSVINNVLKDLENKPSSFTPLELADVPDNKTPARLRYWRVAALVLLIATVLLTYFVYLSKPVGSTVQHEPIEPVEVIPAHKEIPQSTDLQALPLLVKEQPVAAKPEITGLQLNETEKFLELTLQLPLGAQSFLKQSSQNRYVFLISNAVKTIIVPDVKDNDWLQNITILETLTGFEIQFHTLDNVLVETHHKEQGQSYYWVIRLKKSLPVSAVETDSKQIELPDTQQETGVKDTDAENHNVDLASISQQQVKLEIKPVISKQSDAQILQKAREAMQLKDWVLAQQQLEKLLNSRLDKKARIELLALLKVQKKMAEMKLLLAKSLQLYPSENEFLITDAGQLFSAKKFLTLIKRYKSKLDNIKIINLVAASFQSIGQHDNAIDYYQRSLAMNPQQPRKWISLAISQEQKAQFDRALQSYQMALQSGMLNKRLQSFIHNRLQQLSQNTN